MKLRASIAVASCAIALAGCGLSDATHAEHAHMDLSYPHPLLALDRSQVRETHGSVSGAFLFAIGGGGGSISSTVKSYVGFIVRGDDGYVFELRYPADRVDYRLDAQAPWPQVTFYPENQGGWQTGRSVTANLEDDWIVNRVLVTLAPKDFARDIHVLQYAGVGG